MESAAPNVRMDYAFCRRPDDEHVTTTLVMQHHQPRAARCWVVPQTGVAVAVVADIAEGGLGDIESQASFSGFSA